MEYSEFDRVSIAQEEYSNYVVDDVVKYKNIDSKKISIGTVTQIVDVPETGLKVIVVKEPNDDLTILYQGSKAPGEAGSYADWVKTDLPMGVMVMSETNWPFKPEQLEMAAGTLRSVMRQYPNSQVSVYGHSLGSMNAQYALANMDKGQEGRIKGAWVYNGPNIYMTLNDRQQAQLNRLKPKITNYIDSKDFIGMGYPEKGSYQATGLIKRVASRSLVDERVTSTLFSLNGIKDHQFNPLILGGRTLSAISDQHMWGGYQYDKDGNIQVSAEDQALYEQEYARYQMAYRVQSAMADVVSLKETLSSGGLSSSEQLYLDSLQASAVASGLSQAAQHGEETIQKASQDALTKAEALYESLRQVPYGFVLSPDEVVSTYASAGAHYESLVGKLSTKVAKKTKAVTALTETFTSLESQLQTGIEAKIATDQDLARLYQS